MDRIRLKRQNPLLSYVRVRKYTVNVETAHFIITLFNVGNVLSVHNVSIILHRIYVCYTNIMLYIEFGIIRGFT